MSDLTNLAKNLSKEQVIQIVTSLGADRYEDKGEYVIFPTICHNEFSSEASMKLYYYNESHLFHCYTECGESFNIYGLIERRYSILRKDFNIYHIYLSLKNKFGFDDCDFFNETRYVRDKDKYKARKHNDVKLPKFNKGVLDSFIKYYTPEWISDGISKESMDKFNILYSISQNRIIIPHYDLNGELVGIRGRALNPEDIEVFGKYMPIKLEKTWYTHPLSLNLYGLNQTKEAINKKKQAIIFEAE